MSKFTHISKFQGQKRRGLGHVTHFYILGPPSISLELVKPETSNLECGLISSRAAGRLIFLNRRLIAIKIINAINRGNA